MEQTEKQLVDEFAAEMLRKLELRHDRYVPLAWRKLDMKRLVFLLEEEVKELKEARHDIRADVSVRDEALDVANYALFIYWLHHHE